MDQGDSSGSSEKQLPSDIQRWGDGFPHIWMYGLHILVLSHRGEKRQDYAKSFVLVIWKARVELTEMREGAGGTDFG